MTGVPKGVLLWTALILGVFAANRLGTVRLPVGPVVPAVDVDDLSPALKKFQRAMQPVNSHDRVALREYYSGLARAVESDPQADPVLTTTEKLRTAHRAGLLVLWRGFLGNSPNEYPDLREAIEGVLTEAVGSEDVPLNPAIRAKAVAAFQGLAACTSAKP